MSVLSLPGQSKTLTHHRSTQLQGRRPTQQPVQRSPRVVCKTTTPRARKLSCPSSLPSDLPDNASFAPSALASTNNAAPRPPCLLHPPSLIPAQANRCPVILGSPCSTAGVRSTLRHTVVLEDSLGRRSGKAGMEGSCCWATSLVLTDAIRRVCVLRAVGISQRELRRGRSHKPRVLGNSHVLCEPAHRRGLRLASLREARAVHIVASALSQMACQLGRRNQQFVKDTPLTHKTK